MILNDKYLHHKYIWARSGSLYVRHQWSLVGSLGGIEFHFLAKDYEDISSDNFLCNLEFHHFSGEGAPDHLKCSIIGGPCWHEWTTLYATENIWPKIKQHFIENNHPRIFKVLEMVYERHFSQVIADEEGE